MLDQRFYWGTIRKAIVAFGNMFNNINVERRDADGNIIQILKVPLSYASKSKALARIQQRPNVDDRQVQIIVPRMAFEMTTMNYDYNRKISPVQQSRSVNATSNTLDSQYAPTPYNINVQLYVYVKNQDDGLQIVEQIFPFFNPDFSITVNEIPELGIKRDLQIILDSVNYNDEYEGGFDKRLTIIWDFNFTVKLNFYGYVDNATLIKETIQNLYIDNTLAVGTVPVNAEVGTKITTTISPADALPTDAYNYITDFDTIYQGE